MDVAVDPQTGLTGSAAAQPGTVGRRLTGRQGGEEVGTGTGGGGAVERPGEGQGRFLLADPVRTDEEPGVGQMAGAQGLLEQRSGP